MPTEQGNIQKFDVVSATEYTINNGFYMILPKNVSGNIVLAFKATDPQGFVDQEAITESKIVYIPSTVVFKLTFADGTVTLTKVEGYGI